MLRAMQFFPVKQLLLNGLTIGRKTPETPLSVIKHELEAETQLLGDAIVSKRLKDEKAVLEVLEQQQAEYKEQVQQSVEKLMENPVSVKRDFHSWWQQQQHILSLHKPENKEVLADSIDWLKARQIFAKQPILPSGPVGHDTEFSLKNI